MITSIINILFGVSSLVTDWRKCKSVVDDILHLLSLKLPLGNSLPNIILAGSASLNGFSPTRAMTNIIEGLEQLGLPTGDLPSGASNFAVPAIFEQVKGVYQEQLENGKTEVFVPPLAVVALGGGTTFPAKASGKSF